MLNLIQHPNDKKIPKKIREDDEKILIYETLYNTITYEYETNKKVFDGENIT